MDWRGYDKYYCMFFNDSTSDHSVFGPFPDWDSVWTFMKNKANEFYHVTKADEDHYAVNYEEDESAGRIQVRYCFGVFYDVKVHWLAFGIEQ